MYDIVFVLMIIICGKLFNDVIYFCSFFYFKCGIYYVDVVKVMDIDVFCFFDIEVEFVGKVIDVV